jgi:transmembrane sensor
MKIDPPETREDIERIAATWIARRNGESWTEADAALFNAWLTESAGHRVAYYRLNRVWTQLGAVERPSVAVGAGRRYRHFAVAASVLMLLVCSLAAFREGLFDLTSEGSRSRPGLAQVRVEPEEDSPAAEQGDATGDPGASLAGQPFDQRFKTAIGASRTLSLPDGSHVTLDTDTQIRVSMDGRSRVVEFDRGQGYFKVAHDSQRAFVVNAGQLSVIAVGTEFSVRREGSDFRVVVAEGIVRLQPHTRVESPAAALSDEVLLRSGGIARVEGGAIQIRQGQATEVERYLSWRGGVLTFRKTSLADAVAEFNQIGRAHV